MSQRYKGGVISATPPTTSTSSASGVWTEQQFMQGVASGNWPALAGAPTIGTATAGSLSASVTFTAPTYVGSGITGYTVTSNPSGITGTGASSPVTVSGLTAGTPYTFTVTATTAAGQGSASAASNSVTPVPPNYIEDVYSTYLYTGNGSTQTITNNIDLSTKGGVVWIKSRSNVLNNALSMTGLPGNDHLESNTENSVGTNALFTGFTSTGFGLTASGGANTNSNSFAQNLYTSWSFARQAKFFDVVTFTGNNTANQAVPHNLGSVPGFIVIRKISGGGMWPTYHRSLGRNYFQRLNSTTAGQTVTSIWGTTDPTSTDFYVSNVTNPGTGNPFVESGQQYIAMVFAHNAGGFGTSGNDNVISCGTYTGTGAINEINIGYETQWLMTKTTSETGNWHVQDIMRGMTRNYNAPLYPNTNGAEATGSVYNTYPTATGFGFVAGNAVQNSNGVTYIYVAIRRGPMKVPTDATKVYTPVLNSNFTDGVVIPGQPTVDASWSKGTSANQMRIFDRLRGSNVGTNYTLYPDSTGAEGNEAYWALDQQNGVRITATIGTIPYVNYFFSRAAGFFDEVCYTGNNVSGRTITHNLAAVPELMIVKSRTSNTRDWIVYSATNSATNAMNLNNNSVTSSSSVWASTAPTSTVFTVSDSSSVNDPAQNYVAYLFATCPGVSKVGSYTGTGALQTINCGFAAGVRFILIKRTDSTGDWYLYNSASGITSGNDPYFLLNSDAAEVTGTNYVDTTAVGFQVTAAAPAAINASGGTYIFLAIA